MGLVIWFMDFGFPQCLFYCIYVLQLSTVISVLDFVSCMLPGSYGCTSAQGSCVGGQKCKYAWHAYNSYCRFFCSASTLGVENDLKSIQEWKPAIHFPHIPSTGKWTCAIIYQDDIVVLSKEVIEHMGHHWKVLMLLESFGISLKLKKWKSFTKKFNYLGNIICPGKQKFAGHTTDTNRRIEDPTKITEVISLHGICNFSKYFSRT